MSGPLVDKSFTGMIAQMRRDITELQRRLTKGASSSGTTAQRNLLYGIPGTTEERVALANRQITWFNTDKGWVESFYAPTGTAGLLVRGLVAGSAADWYPVGAGPWCVMEPNALKGTTTGAYIGGWNATVRRNGGAEWFAVSANVLQPLKAGVYNFGFWTIQQNGTGTANYMLRVLDASGSVVDAIVDGGAFVLQSTLGVRAGLSAEGFLLKAGQQIAPFTVSGVLNVHFLPTIRGQLYARYVGPPLVSD